MSPLQDAGLLHELALLLEALGERLLHRVDVAVDDEEAEAHLGLARHVAVPEAGDLAILLALLYDDLVRFRVRVRVRVIVRVRVRVRG